MENKSSLELMKLSVLAGAMIGLAGFAYLAVGGVMGSILFSFGLISVYCYGLFLFTGLAGRTPIDTDGLNGLFQVLIGNIFGAILIALLARLSPLPLQEEAQKVFLSHISLGWWKAGLLSIVCGWIVEEAVISAKAGIIIPTFLGVSIFVLCGFPHCIADAFYYALTPVDILRENAVQMIIIYVMIVLGNYLGCNLRRICKI